MSGESVGAPLKAVPPTTKLEMRLARGADAAACQVDFERELDILLTAVRAGAITMRSLSARWDAHV